MDPSKGDGQIVLTEERIGFEPDQLISCAACGRKNAPNRFKCMYCAAGLAVPEAMRESVRLDTRKPEAWENGYNVIATSAPNDLSKVSDLAKTTGIDDGFFIQALRKLPLPVARVGSKNEADIIEDRLRPTGIKTLVVEDKTLDSYSPQRVRSLVIDDDCVAFVMFNSDDVARVAIGDVNLMVAGKLIENEIETTERRKFRKAEFDDQILTKRKYSLIDVYTGRSAFRIHEQSFDFSCLGPEKTLLAAENAEKLGAMLREVLPNAAYDSGYNSLRELLGVIWELDESQEAGGISRSGLGQLLVTRNTKQTNTRQFNRYSAMLRHLR